MDVKSLSELLKGTIDPTLRNEAEKKLAEVHKIIGFGPILLQVVMSNEVELPVRQAAVIYLKNMVSGSWVDREPDTPGAPVPFSVHEQDRALIRWVKVHFKHENTYLCSMFLGTMLLTP